MISIEVIGRFDQPTQEAIKSSLAILHSTGLIQAQLEENLRNLMIGSNTESPEVLAKRILEHRAKANQLSELDSIGEIFHREMNHHA